MRPILNFLMFLMLFQAFFVPLSSQAALTTREDVFDFTVAPKIIKQGDGYLITFTSAGNCDVTISILNPKGQVIRHLASGVLGANAPEPLQKNSLAQSIAWDGKDDKGVLVSDSSVVKISLGLKAVYNNDFSNQYGFNPSAGMGMLVDKEGTLYTIQNSTIRCFTSNAAYSKTILPPRAGVTPANFAINAWLLTKWGDSALTTADWFTPFNKFICGNHNFGSPTIGEDGRLAVMYFQPSRLTMMHIFGQDGSLPATSSMKFGNRTDYGHDGDISIGDDFYRGGGVHHMAASPDGKWIYLSGAGNAVLRYRWNELHGPITTRIPVKIFVGDTVVGKDTVGSGARNDRFNMVTGITCDKFGNLYVGDHGNNRIQVYDSNGVFLRSVKCTAPYQIAVNPSDTSVLYVLSFKTGKAIEPALSKISSSGTKLANLPITANWYMTFFPYTAMALDSRTDSVFLWLFAKKGVYKVKDNGTSFQEVKILGSDQDTTFYAGTPGGVGLKRATVDRTTEEVYLMSVARRSPLVRMDGRTGKRDMDWDAKTNKNPIVDVAVSPDGLIYAREGGGSGSFGAFITRYTHDGTPVPFANGVPIPATRGSGTFVGKTAIYTGHKGWSNVFQTGFDVSPTGVIGASVHEISMDWLNAIFPSGRSTPVPLCSLDQAALCIKAVDKTEATFLKDSGYTYGTTGLIQLWNSDGTEKCLNAFIAPTRGCGLFLDKRGSMFMSNCFTIPGISILEPAPTWYIKKNNINAMPGTIFKLDGNIGGCSQIRAYKGTAGTGQLQLSDMKSGGNWIIPDVGWASQIAGSTFNSMVCGCGQERFDMDDFDRIWMPANYLNSILVLDANGNNILRIGRYGNADSRGPGSIAPEPDIALCMVNAVAASDEALYVIDDGNNRTLRAALRYEKEVSLNLDGTINTAVEKISLAKRFALHQNNPNPFNPTTRIKYQIPGKSDVFLAIFDVRGKLVQRLNYTQQEIGTHEIELNFSGLPSGLYLYELKAGCNVSRKTMALVR